MANGGYWSPTRLNGKPLEPGQVCWITEIDGMNPIATYGKNEQEVIEKLSLNQAHAQAALARRTPAATEPPAVPGAQPQSRRRMSADEVVQATTDLQNPARAGEAVSRLVADATGIDLKQMVLNNFAAMAMDWMKTQPNFYAHPGNKRLLTTEAQKLAGGDLASVNADFLTKAYYNLLQRGELMPQPVQLPPNAPPTQDPPPFPGETPVQRSERPRGAAPFATGHRGTSFASPTPGAAPKTPKFTAEEIRRMPEARMRELNNPSNPEHQAYNEACEFHFGMAASA